MSQTIYTHEFENGLALIAEEIPWVESAAFSFLVPAGCRYDTADRLGLASVTCDMMLRGAGDRSSRKLIQDLENLGVERSESVSNSHTSFSGATLKDNLAAALEIYADMLLRPRLPAEQLDAAKLVVLQELQAIEDEPGQKAMLEVKRRHYPDPYGRPSQGEVEHVRKVTDAEIAQHYRQNYRPNGAILGVAGNFEWKALKETVGSLLNEWKKTDEVEPVVKQRESRVSHIRQDTNQTQVAIAYDSVPLRDPDYFPAWGAVGVLSGGMSARLFTEVREKRGLCYSVYATHHSLRDRGSVLCYAGTSADRAQDTLDVTVGELKRLADGVRPDELNRLKARIKSALIMQQESSAARSGAIARDWYHLGRARTLDEIGQQVDGLTCDRINDYLASHPPHDFTVVTLGPEPLTIPNGKQT